MVVDDTTRMNVRWKTGRFHIEEAIDPRKYNKIIFTASQV